MRPVSPRLAVALSRLLARPAELRRIGPFWLEEQLGQGSFAPVWLAREVYGTTFVRKAAVKLFALGSVGARGQERIAREARGLCQVEHPHVVRFYALPLDEEAGVGGLAMEYVAGRSLGQRIRDEGPLHPETVARIGISMASALDAVHRAGLVHRDVKPDNVVESNDVHKLIDFGIAQGDEARTPDPSATKGTGDEQGTVRAPFGPSGTPGYVDPACLAGAAPSPASDLYALGAMLHACLVGQPPPAPPSRSRLRWGREVPADLALLIEALLAEDRRKRPASAAEVAHRLGQRDPWRGETRADVPPARKRPSRKIAVAMAALVVSGGAGLGWSRGAASGAGPEDPAKDAPPVRAPVIESVDKDPAPTPMEPRREGKADAEPTLGPRREPVSAPEPAPRRPAPTSRNKPEARPAREPDARRARVADGFEYEDEWR